MDSNHVCREAEDLQSPAVASAALNPKYWSHRRNSNPQPFTSEANALIQLSYGGIKTWCAQTNSNRRPTASETAALSGLSYARMEWWFWVDLNHR